MIKGSNISFYSPLLFTHVRPLTLMFCIKVVLIVTQPINKGFLSTYYVSSPVLDPGEKREGYIKYVKGTVRVLKGLLSKCHNPYQRDL